MKRVVQHKHIEITIKVVIEERCLGGETDKIQTKLHCSVFEQGNTIGVIAFIYKQLVFTFINAVISKIAYIKIKPAVTIDVNHGYTGSPSVKAFNTGDICYILKL